MFQHNKLSYLPSQQCYGTRRKDQANRSRPHTMFSCIAEPEFRKVFSSIETFLFLLRYVLGVNAFWGWDPAEVY